jgi:hypothetical protein
MNLDDFIGRVTDSRENNPLTGINENERDGNTGDLLLRFEQSAGINIAGGTTLTSISPSTALDDLTNGRLTLPVIIWLIIVAVLGYWALKKAR